MSKRAIFVVGALLRRDGRLLLVEEREPSDPESTWMLPGGRVEIGETLTDALRFLSGEKAAGVTYVFERR